MAIKSLHITNSWHAASGGISTFYRQLLAAANRHRRPLRLIVPGGRTYIEEVGEYGRIYVVEGVRAPLNAGYRLVMPDNYLFPGERTVREIIKREQPEVVEVCDKYCFNYLGGLLRKQWLPGLKHYRPTVLGLSCERMDENVMAYVTRHPLALRLTRFYMRHLYFPLFDHHIANSDHTAAELRPASEGHDVRRGVWVCPMGVDCDGYGPHRRSAAIRQELESLTRGTADSVILFYAGRLVPEKYPGLLLDVMECGLPGRDLRLLVAGTGILLDALKAEGERRSPGRIHFLGHIGDRNRLADLYANSDLFVHPNPREPFGIAPLEAMASGLPLVAPNAGGVVTYANAANSWLAPATAPAFLAAIEDALGDPQRERKLQSARATAESYRWENVTAQFLQLYEDLHALRLGNTRNPALAPRFYSTSPGWQASPRHL